MTDRGLLEAPGVRPTIGDLRKVRELLLAKGEAPALAVAQAITAILRGDDAVSAFGLKATAGKRSALTTDRITIRDDLLRRMAARHCDGMSTSAQARLIAGQAKAYWLRAARLDGSLEEMPSSYLGMPREFLFHIARLPATVPSERTIRLILSR